MTLHINRETLLDVIEFGFVMEMLISGCFSVFLLLLWADSKSPMIELGAFSMLGTILAATNAFQAFSTERYPDAHPTLVGES